jgi:Ca-activated chloride channel family protein
MNFLTPVFLALAGLAIPIIILYMLRLRRREVVVSSNMLWQRLMQDREANTPWQRLRRNLLLLLQLLILAALVLALARPYLPVPSVAAGSVALLLDASASMNAQDMPGGVTRFEAAKEQAAALVGELANDEVMTIIAVGSVPQVLTPATGDRAALREAISQAEPSQAQGDWEAALALAGASIAGREEASILIISDGGLPETLPPIPAEVHYLQVGRSADNLAIGALAVRSLDNVPHLFASVANYSEQDADVILSIYADDQLDAAERLSVPAGESVDFTLDSLPETTQVIRAELTSPVEGGLVDRLPLDDVAHAVYAPPRGGRVLLFTEGNLFLEHVLRALPGIEAFRAPPGRMPEGEFDLIVYDGWVPDTLPEGNLLIVNPNRTTNLFTVGETFTDTRLLRQADDTILSFVDFEDIAIREAVGVRATGWAQTLVEAEGGPLLLAGALGGSRVAVLTFDLHASDLPLRIEFPILIANLLDWYSPAQPFEITSGLRPGDPVVIRPQASTVEYTITAPDGSSRSYPVGETPLTYTETDQTGIYRVDLQTGQGEVTTAYFAVNLFAPAESRIRPAGTIFVGEGEVAGSESGDEFGQRELWPWLAVLVFLVLLVEWWVFHRGSVLPRPARLSER